MMLVYDAEVRKGIEDKEIFSALYDARFSEANRRVREAMEIICRLHASFTPKLKSHSQESYLINRLLKRSTNGKK